MPEYHLSARSLRRLTGVHPDLKRVVLRAIKITRVDFTVLAGLRSLARQKWLYEHGKSKTMNSRHLDGHAVDLMPYAPALGEAVWERWDLFKDVSRAMKTAARLEGVALEWGGDWRRFRDGAHYQLPWADYPAVQKAEGL